MMTPDQYIADRLGKAYDYDGAYGAQCWDLWAHFCLTAGYPVINTGSSGYAKDLWLERNTNGVLKYFKTVSIKKLKKGDWLIWGDCAYAPASHVGMFVNYSGAGRLVVMGQNQLGIPAATKQDAPMAGLLGAFRPNCWASGDGGGGDPDNPDPDPDIPVYENKLKITCVCGLITNIEVVSVPVEGGGGGDSGGGGNHPDPGGSQLVYTAEKFRQLGKVTWGGYTWTWYSELVLPGGGLVIPGRHVDKDGYICDDKNHICLAGSVEQKKAGTVVATPFGKSGKVYDVCPEGTMDVYVHW